MLLRRELLLEKCHDILLAELLDVEIFLTLGTLHSKDWVLASNMPVLHIREVREFIVNKFFDGRISLDFSVAIFKGGRSEFDTLQDRIVCAAATTLPLQATVFGYLLKFVTSTANDGLRVSHVIARKLSGIGTGADQEQSPHWTP